MDCRSIIVLYLHIVTIHMAPLQMQGLHPMQPVFPMESLMQMQSQQASLQQQLLALQQLRLLQNMETVHSPSTLYLPQPMLILLPYQQNNEDTENGKLKSVNEQDLKENDLNHKSDKEYVDEDLDSVIIEADSNAIENRRSPQRAVVLLPNGRFSIGEFISAIPWLPFEVNVPDTIAWAYNGISSGIAGIISIIGQRLPFRPRYPMNPQEPSMKIFLKKFQLNKENPGMPILVMPIDRVLPINEMILPVNAPMVPINSMMAPNMPIMPMQV